MANIEKQENLQKEVENNKQQIDAIVDKIYPVGSIYMSMNAISPSSFFGGTWVKIEGCFLLGSSSSYSLGATGGEATHVLTTNEMPSHSHTATFYNDDFSNGGDSQSSDKKKQSPGLTYDVGWKNGAWQYSSNATGGGAAHNNMPPYLVVNIWKRTA